MQASGVLEDALAAAEASSGYNTGDDSEDENTHQARPLAPFSAAWRLTRLETSKSHVRL